jgi:hypothetical protein
MLRLALFSSLSIVTAAAFACATPATLPAALVPPAVSGPALCQPCRTSSVADGTWRCEINGGTDVTVGGGSIAFVNGLGQRGSGCFSCDGSYEAVSERGDWSNVNGRFTARDDTATLAWQWCLAPLDACRASGGNMAGPVPCTRKSPLNAAKPTGPAAPVVIPAPRPEEAPPVVSAPALGFAGAAAATQTRVASFDLTALPPLAPLPMEETRAAGECRREGGYSSPMGESDFNFEVFVFGAEQQLIRAEDVGGEVCVLHGVNAPGCKPGATGAPINLRYGGTRLSEITQTGDGLRVQMLYDAQDRVGAVVSERKGKGDTKGSTEYVRYGSDGQIEARATDDNSDGRVDRALMWDFDVVAQGRAERFNTRAEWEERSASYAYDAAGRLQTVTQKISSFGSSGEVALAQKVTSYTYDPAGRLIREATCISVDDCIALSFRYRPDGTLHGASESRESGGSSEDNWSETYSPGCLLKVSGPAPAQVYNLPNEIARDDEKSAALLRLSVVAKAGSKVSRANRPVLR